MCLHPITSKNSFCGRFFSLFTLLPPKNSLNFSCQDFLYNSGQKSHKRKGAQQASSGVPGRDPGEHFKCRFIMRGAQGEADDSYSLGNLALLLSCVLKGLRAYEHVGMCAVRKMYILGINQWFFKRNCPQCIVHYWLKSLTYQWH